ncbi:WD40 repeat domain-containing serine/threonine protein kinase [Parafrankia sp. BMG5.11]|uniref:WD40 repeat domain-containing serine/threonine protein kinase n=1 Tax=Parafrankia sp. BMG5.11 TaxID=222540 RepID=UPI001FB5150E|nr:serine/threonine-protein kinase [Parafrankia sp. BMG5.11]
MIVDRERVVAALPGYKLGAQLGRGAFGLVVAGCHRELNRDVAIKILSAEAERTTERGRAEGRLLATLDHPHIVRVYDAAAVDDLYLIVMELLRDGTLSERRTDMTTEGFCAVGLAVAVALSHAHEQPKKVLHRDIKPGNIMFDSTGLLKVTDFGIAKIMEGSATTTSAVMGTPLYMAPEQLLGGKLTPATDLYSLGVMIYELLAGAPPFATAMTIPALMHHHLNVPPPVPEGVPAPLVDVVMRALAKEPRDRPPSAHAFALDLARAATAVHGPGWTDRAGVILHLHSDVRAATEKPVIHTDPTWDISVSRASAGTAAIPIHSDDRPTVGDEETSKPVSRPSTRRWFLGAAAAVPLAVAGTVVPTVAVPAFRKAAADPPRADPRLLGPPLTGYSEAVWSATFPSYRTERAILTTATRNGMVRLWNVTDPAAASLLGSTDTDSPDSVGTVALAPNGHLLAAVTNSLPSDRNSTVSLWRITENAQVELAGSLPGLVEFTFLVAFRRDGSVLVTVTDDARVRLWDVADPAAAHLIGTISTGHTNRIESVVFSPDDRTIATAGHDDTVRLWDISNPADIRALCAPISGHTQWVQSVDFTSDGHAMAIGGGTGTVRLFDTSDLTSPTPFGPPFRAHTGWVQSVSFYDGLTLITGGGGDAMVRLWNVTDLASPVSLGSPLAGHTGVVMSLATGFIGPGRRVLASASQDRTVRLWQIE